MVDKYRGITPPGSIWFYLSRGETIQYLKFRKTFDQLSPEQIAGLKDSDIQGQKEKISELEADLRAAGLIIITLHD